MYFEFKRQSKTIGLTRNTLLSATPADLLASNMVAVPLTYIPFPANLLST